MRDATSSHVLTRPHSGKGRSGALLSVRRGAGVGGKRPEAEGARGKKVNLLSLREEAGKTQKSQTATHRDPASKPPEPPSACPTTRPLQVVSTRHGVVSCYGDPADLWERTGREHLAPSFPRGAGHTLEDYEAAMGENVEMVGTVPHTKEAPYRALPLDSFNLRVVCERGRTGFEGGKDYLLEEGALVAGRYRIKEYLDEATFSRTVSATDIEMGADVCLKVIRNSKDYVDQSIDEIKLLRELNSAGDPDGHCILRMCDYFYFKEHIFIVTELLGDNLYRVSKRDRGKAEAQRYFTLSRVQSIARQLLTALRLIHSLDLIHCDLKPENILVKSLSQCLIKVIDFGSSCYSTDSLSSYVQSRAYRSPEVILGCRYSGAVDIWSLGAILAELASGKVLFDTDTIARQLAIIATLRGPFPARMLHEGRNTHFYITKHGAVYEYRERQLIFHFADKNQSPDNRYGYDDASFVDFVHQCLTVDPLLRPSAMDLMQHPFLLNDYGSTAPTT